MKCDSKKQNFCSLEKQFLPQMCGFCESPLTTTEEEKKYHFCYEHETNCILFLKNLCILFPAPHHTLAKKKL